MHDGLCVPLEGLMHASQKMMLREWTGSHNYWTLEGERRCTHRSSGVGRCDRPSQGARLCNLHWVHEVADRQLATVLLSLRHANADFYVLLISWPLSLQRMFLVDCLWM